MNPDPEFQHRARGTGRGAPARLALFDIDGTLLTTNGQAVAAMLDAYRAVYGITPPRDAVAMDGKTELHITHAVLGAAGLSREQVVAGLEACWAAYTQELERRLTVENVTVFPGVRALLGRLSGMPEVVVGLLTGNIAAGAEAKLHIAGLGGFTVGAYGQHHEARADLPALAVAEARRVAGVTFRGKEVAIIGDTPHDIACGRPLGAKAIAVATGRFSTGELAAYAPDHLFGDLTDTDAVLRAILE